MRPRKRLVRAVLAPGLGHRLELAVGRVAAELGEMALDRLHLGKTERELPRAAQRKSSWSSSERIGTWMR